MSDKVSGRKQPSFVPKQGTSREKGTSSSDMSVYKSSAEESVRNMDRKQSSIYKSSEEYFEYSCDPCKTVGDHVEAQGYCTNCEEYLCGTCFRCHSRSKTSKHHTLLDKDAMRKMTVKNCYPCKTAGDEIEAAGHCKDCDEYLCDSCYKSHARSKTSRHHVLVDKDRMPEKSDSAVTSSIAKMNIHTEGAGELKYNEDYTHIRDINIKADTDDKDCYITGMTLVSNTELVLCDQDNNSLKLVDVENGIIKDVLELQDVPLGITVISIEQVAVVIRDKYQIQIVSIDGGLSKVRTVKTTGRCVDVKLNNGKLYMSFLAPVQFQILQLTGAIIKTIKPDSEVLKHCAIPRYIAVSPDESIIYVSDWERNKVMSMDMNGNMISTYQGELDKPCDIAISPFGSVYLCNVMQDIVYKMTPDLREATVILGPADGLLRPQAMCFNTDKQHFYISSGSKGVKYEKCIKVYQWK